LAALPALAQFPYGIPFDLGAAQSVIVGDEGLVVGFDGVFMESRCPTGVVCVWEGDAEASMWVEAPGRPREEFILHTSAMFQTSRDLGGAIIHLLDVRPYPVHGGTPIPPLMYDVTLLVLDTGPLETEPSSWGTLKALYR
jgi:hypothetical protein